MTPATESTGSGASGLIRPLTVLVLAIAFVTAGYGNYLGQDGPTTFADMFSENSTVDLKTNGQDSVRGIIGGLIAPGDTVSGVVQLTADTGFLQEPFDLDIDLRYTTRSNAPHPPPGGVPLPLERWLFFSKMKYGTDDLLAAGGRNLIEEIDRHPIFGNNDGKLSIYEFQAGINDLPRPGPATAPTAYQLEVLFAANAPNYLQGQILTVEFVFLLAGVQEADLN